MCAVACPCPGGGGSASGVLMLRIIAVTFPCSALHTVRTPYAPMLLEVRRAHFRTSTSVMTEMLDRLRHGVFDSRISCERTHPVGHPEIDSLLLQ